MDLPQAAHWKAVSDKEITSLEKHGVFQLIWITSVHASHKLVGTRFQSIRVMLAIAAELDFEVHTLNVQTAFLNADVEEGVFIKMAPDYKTNDKQKFLLS